MCLETKNFHPNYEKTAAAKEPKICAKKKQNSFLHSMIGKQTKKLVRQVQLAYPFQK